MFNYLADVLILLEKGRLKMLDINKADTWVLTRELRRLAVFFDDSPISQSELLLRIGHYFWENREGRFAYEAYKLAGKSGTLPEIAKERMGFLGKMCVITGTLDGTERSEAFDDIIRLGGRVSDNPVNTMDILIMGYPEWSAMNDGVITRKVKKALDLQKKGRDIKILSESEFYSILSDFLPELCP